jgi:hypothetical protein
MENDNAVDEDSTRPLKRKKRQRENKPTQRKVEWHFWPKCKMLLDSIRFYLIDNHGIFRTCAPSPMTSGGRMKDTHQLEVLLTEFAQE